MNLEQVHVWRISSPINYFSEAIQEMAHRVVDNLEEASELDLLLQKTARASQDFDVVTEMDAFEDYVKKSSRPFNDAMRWVERRLALCFSHDLTPLKTAQAILYGRVGTAFLFSLRTDWICFEKMVKSFPGPVDDEDLKDEFARQYTVDFCVHLAYTLIVSSS